MIFQLLAGWWQQSKVYFSSMSTDEEVGQGLVEYAMILVLVSMVMVVLLVVLGPGIRNVFANILYNIQTGTQ